MNPEIKSVSIYAISTVLAILNESSERAEELKIDLERNNLTIEDFESAMEELDLN